MSERWRSINTAPKDGTEILLKQGSSVAVGGWVKPFWLGERDESFMWFPLSHPEFWAPLPKGYEAAE